MAQTQKPTRQGYAEIAKLVAGENASKVAKICGYTGSSVCVAAETSTYTTPATNATKATTMGFAMAAANSVVTSTTTVAGDTVEVDHVFTATGSININGFGIYNNEATPDVLFMECCFNTVIPCEAGDTITVEAKMQFKLGS